MNGEVIRIDLNADLGEGFGPYTIGEDDALLGVVSSANIACGFHAGDPHIMRRTVERCVERGAAIGAHPGLPDREGFGRREWKASAAEVADWVTYQTGALQAFVKAAGSRLQHVKPHGALYHMASRDAELAEAIAAAVHAADPGLLLYGPPRSRLEEAAKRLGLGFVAEGFADRAYLADGTLAPRNRPGAVIEDPELALRQALSLVREGQVRSLEGSFVEVAVRSICLHGDTPRAAVLAGRIAAGLRSQGVEIRAFDHGSEHYVPLR